MMFGLTELEIRDRLRENLRLKTKLGAIQSDLEECDAKCADCGDKVEELQLRLRGYKAGEGMLRNDIELLETRLGAIREVVIGCMFSSSPQDALGAMNKIWELVDTGGSEPRNQTPPSSVTGRRGTPLEEDRTDASGVR